METKLRFVSPVEKALYLKTVPLLAGLDSGQMGVMVQYARERFFRKDSPIHRPGEAVTSIHLIVEGRVAVHGAGNPRQILGPRNLFGLLALLSRSQEGMEATAVEDTVTLELEAEDLYDAMEDHFSILTHAIQGIASLTLRERQAIEDGTYLAPAENVLECPDRELDLAERLVFLTRSTGLSQVNMDSLVMIARQMEESRFQPGHRLWKTGDPSGFIYILVDGKVRCRLPDGRSFVAGPGYPLGNLESLAVHTRWYDAVVETPTVALGGRTDWFLDLLEDHFDMARGVLQTMAGGLMHILEKKAG